MGTELNSLPTSLTSIAKTNSMSRQVEIYDTTLRDGTQAENFNLSVNDKIRISRQLDELGMDQPPAR